MSDPRRFTRILLPLTFCAMVVYLVGNADVPLVAAVPPSPLFVTAANRQEPAWRLDPQLATSLLPLARTIWPLDSLGNHAHSRGRLLPSILRRVRGVVSRAGR